MKRLGVGLAVFSSLIWSNIARADGPADGAPKGSATGSVATVDEKAPKRVPFYGFSFDFTMADSSGLNAVGENYRNDLNFYFEPSWNVGARFLRHTWAKTFQIAGRFAVTQNLSGVDETNFGPNANAGPETPCFGGTPSTQGGQINPSTVPYCHPAANDRRTDYSDIWLTFRMPKVYTIPKVGIYLSPSVRFIFPTSVESRFSTLIMGTTTSLSIGRSFWKDRIQLGMGAGISKNFHQSSTAQIAGSSGAGVAGSTQGGNASDLAASNGISNFYADPSRLNNISGYNVNYAGIGSFTGAVHFTDKLSFDILYLIIANVPYNHSCTVNVPGYGIYDTCSSGNAVAANSGTTVDRPGNHDVQVFWATLAYQPLDWLGVSLAWINWAPLLNPNSTYRQGIISTDYNSFTTVQLGVTVTLDKLGAKLLKN